MLRLLCGMSYRLAAELAHSVTLMAVGLLAGERVASISLMVVDLLLTRRPSRSWREDRYERLIQAER